MELGRAVRGLSYGAVDKVLSWDEGACQDFLANGTEPRAIHRAYASPATASASAHGADAAAEAPPRHLQALEGGNEPSAPDDQVDLGDEPFPGVTHNFAGLNTPEILNDVWRMVQELQARADAEQGVRRDRQRRAIERYKLAVEELAEEINDAG